MNPALTGYLFGISLYARMVQIYQIIRVIMPINPLKFTRSTAMRPPFGLRWFEVAVLIVLILMAVIGAFVLIGPQSTFCAPPGPGTPTTGLAC